MLRAQDQAKLDSLNTLLEKAEYDTTKARLLIDIGREYSMGDIEVAEGKFEQALSYAKKADSKKREAEALLHIGKVYFNQANYPLSSEYFTKSLKIAEEIGETGRSIRIRW